MDRTDDDSWDAPDSLPPGWRLGPMTYEPRTDGWCAFAFGPQAPTEDAPLECVMGCGADASSAVRDLIARLSD